VGEGLAAVDLDPEDIETGHVGNFAAELFAGQGLLGGMFGLVHPAFDGLPTARHEAACASGSVAILAATAEIEAGRYDLACVVGIEQMRNVPGQKAAENLGAAAWAGHEFQDARFLWPARLLGPRRRIRPALWPEVRAPDGYRRGQFRQRQAQFQRPDTRLDFGPEAFTDDPVANPVVEGRTRKQDCGQVTDGAAVVFLASERRARAYADKRGVALDSIPRIKGWGHRSAPLSYARKVEASREAASTSSRRCAAPSWTPDRGPGSGRTSQGSTRSRPTTASPPPNTWPSTIWA
jgi:acetyl-CoA C-acetyltransferase